MTEQEQKDFDELKAKVEELTTMNTELQTEHDTAQKELETFKSDNTKLTEDLNKSKTLNDELQRKIIDKFDSGTPPSQASDFDKLCEEKFK